MKNFKCFVTDIYSHTKSAELKWPIGIKRISPSEGVPPSEINRLLEKTRAMSEAEQARGDCSFLITLAEEMLEVCDAADAGDWKACYDELGDAAAVIIRAMELIHPRTQET